MNDCKKTGFPLFEKDNITPNILRPNIRPNSTIFQDIMAYLDQSTIERFWLEKVAAS